MKVWFVLPFLGFLLLITCLMVGLHKEPLDQTVALKLRAVPSLNLSTLEDPTSVITESFFRNRITVLNVWSTWCSACQKEHSTWLAVSKDYPELLIGLNYHDDRSSARYFLKTSGDPYELTLFDEKGRFGLDLGIIGTPETIIIDSKGLIRDRYRGPVSKEVWETRFLPIIKALGKS